MMNSMRASRSERKVLSVLAVLAAGIFIVCLTVYVILAAAQPDKPEASGDVAPPQDNTPFVGKKW
jgi:hypothetical protein